MLSKYSEMNMVSDTAKFENRVMKGVPMFYRREMWMILLGIKRIKQSVKEEYSEFNRRNDRSKHDKQIDLDINRTFQLHYKYREKYCLKQKELFYVLHPLSRVEPELGCPRNVKCSKCVYIVFETIGKLCCNPRIMWTKISMERNVFKFRFVNEMLENDTNYHERTLCWNV